MKGLLRRLWSDEQGFVTSTEAVLFATIVGIGLICGLTTVRDQLSTELGDIANMMARIDHSFSYAAVTTDCGVAGGSIFSDEAGFCEPFTSGAVPPVWIGPTFFVNTATSE